MTVVAWCFTFLMILSEASLIINKCWYVIVYRFSTSLNFQITVCLPDLLNVSCFHKVCNVIYVIQYNHLLNYKNLMEKGMGYFLNMW